MHVPEGRLGERRASPRHPGCGPSYSKGTAHTVNLSCGTAIDDVFWAWDPIRRIGFSISASSVRRSRGDCGCARSISLQIIAAWCAAAS
jgi:hypothetical protein